MKSHRLAILLTLLMLLSHASLAQQTLGVPNIATREVSPYQPFVRWWWNGNKVDTSSPC